jgi:hypothetical protein
MEKKQRNLMLHLQIQSVLLVKVLRIESKEIAKTQFLMRRD